MSLSIGQCRAGEVGWADAGAVMAPDGTRAQRGGGKREGWPYEWAQEGLGAGNGQNLVGCGSATSFVAQ